MRRPSLTGCNDSQYDLLINLYPSLQLVNSSRAVIYASSGEDFAEKAGEEARKVREEMVEWV